MPLVLKFSTAHGWMALWRIEESVTQLIKMVPAADSLLAFGMLSDNRRLQWLSWRAMVYQLLPGVEIAYNNVGAPVLIRRTHDAPDEYISVSHTGSYVAVVYSSQTCAVDMERMERRFEKVSQRFMSSSESVLSANMDSRFMAAVWCGKETMYKYAGTKQLDLIDDLVIREINFTEESTVCQNGDTIIYNIGTIRGCLSNTKVLDMEILSVENMIIGLIA